MLLCGNYLILPLIISHKAFLKRIYETLSKKMTKQPDKQLVPREVSALYTYRLLENMQGKYPEIDLPGLIDQVVEITPGYVENLKTGQ